MQDAAAEGVRHQWAVGCFYLAAARFEWESDCGRSGTKCG